MREFNKVLILKIVSLSISMLLLFTNIIYSRPVLQEYLRPPIGETDDTLDYLENKMKSTAIADYKKKLQKYLGGKKLSNPPEVIEKVLSVIENYSQGGKKIILEIGGGEELLLLQLLGVTKISE